MPAPAFEGVDQNGKKISLETFSGRKLILYFYPKDDTPTCTKEACNLRDNFSMLKKKKYSVLGVSPDSEKSHKKFSEKFSLPFPLLVDEDMKVVKAYGVWGKKKLYGREYMGVIRTTFVIDAAGKIERIIEDVDSGDHANQVLEPQG
jgi:peroxiredoxin Q/BCP